MNILNLTQHPATSDQLAAGVIEPTNKSEVQLLLTFETLPERGELIIRANQLALIAKNHNVNSVMIGGAPFFMAPLELAMKVEGITPSYSFTQRVAEDVQQPDGSVKKSQVFKHMGFVKA